jgi:hypothetical protein
MQIYSSIVVIFGKLELWFFGGALMRFFEAIKKIYLLPVFVLLILNTISCIINNCKLYYLLLVLISAFFSLLGCILEYKLINKGIITMGMKCAFYCTFVFALVISAVSIFIKNNYTIISLCSSTVFVVDLLYIKIFDIKGE